jgi:hypothetical protein
MSETKSNALDAMLAQYETNNKPKYENKEKKVYSLDNYFTTYIPDGVKAATKEIRILPTVDGKSPFVVVHAHKVQVEGKWTTFTCLKHEKNEPCPFCEAREALLATGKDSDKELAKTYNAKKMYVVKVIDRNAEEEGVKFWRFNHDYRSTGTYDKIYAVLTALKKDRDITSATNGRDLTISISRDQNNKPQIVSINAQDSGPLSEDATKLATWTADVRTWEDVYAVKSYDFLEIIVKGGIPAWDKEAKKFVDKASLKSEVSDGLNAEITMGVENVKAGVTAATSETAGASSEAEADELPF